MFKWDTSLCFHSLLVLTPMLSGASRPFVSWAVPGIWFAMLSHVVCGSQQQLCCKFDACAATLDATGLGHLLGVDSASCSCECVVSSTWMPSSAWFDVVLWCDGSSFVPVPLSAVQPPSAHVVLFSVQFLSEVAPGCCFEIALMFQVSEFGLGEDELKNPVSEIVPGWPESALLADVVRAATLFMFTPVCFQSFEGSDGGLGPRFLKLSGPALLAAMILLRPCMLHGNLGGEFFRLLFAPVKCSSGTPERGEMKAKLKRTRPLPLFIGCFPFRCSLAGMGLQPCPQLRSSSSSWRVQALERQLQVLVRSILWILGLGSWGFRFMRRSSHCKRCYRTRRRRSLH